MDLGKGDRKRRVIRALSRIVTNARPGLGQTLNWERNKYIPVVTFKRVRRVYKPKKGDQGTADFFFRSSKNRIYYEVEAGKREEPHTPPGTKVCLRICDGDAGRGGKQ